MRINNIQIKNLTRGTIVSSSAICCRSIFEKARGLMFSRRERQKDLIFAEKEERKIPLHMWFVFYSIDILYLNNKKEVVEIKKKFSPFTIYFPKEKAMYVLELRNGTVKRSRTEVRDSLVFDL